MAGGRGGGGRATDRLASERTLEREEGERVEFGYEEAI